MVSSIVIEKKQDTYKAQHRTKLHNTQSLKYRGYKIGVIYINNHKHTYKLNVKPNQSCNKTKSTK